MSVRNAVVLGLVLVGALALTACQKEGPEIQELEPGLQYIETQIGTGETVGANDFVEVHYTGWLYDPADSNQNGHRGNQFDSSVERGEPIAFPLGRGMVIPGWDRGLVGMKVGGKRTLIIAPELAYGANGRPPIIPANSTLIFDTEIMGLPKVDVEVLEEGTGPVAEVGDAVEVHYTGWLWENGAKGKEFDSSRTHGRPFRFSLGRRMVIQGWDLAIEGMPVGQKARLIIPPVLGYGHRGSPPVIPPDATLCFEVELVSIDGK